VVHRQHQEDPRCIRQLGDDRTSWDEIGRLAAEGALNHVHVATSRQRPGRRNYVQDRIREQGALVWRLLAADVYVYVYGSQPMRDAVRVAFADVIAEHESLPRQHAEACLDQLETATRSRPDLCGLTLGARMDTLAILVASPGAPSGRFGQFRVLFSPARRCGLGRSGYISRRGPLIRKRRGGSADAMTPGNPS
jgi:hypothetical protein